MKVNKKRAKEEGVKIFLTIEEARCFVRYGGNCLAPASLREKGWEGTALLVSHYDVLTKKISEVLNESVK